MFRKLLGVVVALALPALLAGQTPGTPKPKATLSHGSATQVQGDVVAPDGPAVEEVDGQNNDEGVDEADGDNDQNGLDEPDGPNHQEEVEEGVKDADGPNGDEESSPPEETSGASHHKP